MEALGVSRISAPAAARSSIMCGFNARGGNRTNVFTLPSSSSTQEDRKLSTVSEDFPALERRGRGRTCRDGYVWVRSKMAFASVVSGLASAQCALAVSYNEVVGSAEEAVNSGTDSLSFDLPEVDSSTVADFVSSNPLALLGGVAIVALPLLFATILKNPEGYGFVSAKQAFAKLGDVELNSQLLDIRAGDDTKSDGKPDLKVYKKKVTQLPYISEPEEYVAKVLKRFKDAEDATIYVIDRFDGNSLDVAKLLAEGGFKAAYAIKDGAEGPSGWQTSELPWVVPGTFSLDLGGFKELLSTSDTGNILPTTLGVAAAAGVGLVVFSEAETALQLLGSAALVQLFVKKFLFAADRNKTLEELKIFLDTKVAPKEIVDELKEIAGLVLPKFEEVKAVTVNGAASETSPLPAEVPTPTEPTEDERRKINIAAAESRGREEGLAKGREEGLAKGREEGLAKAKEEAAAKAEEEAAAKAAAKAEAKAEAKAKEEAEAKAKEEAIAKAQAKAKDGLLASLTKRVRPPG